MKVTHILPQGPNQIGNQRQAYTPPFYKLQMCFLLNHHEKLEQKNSHVLFWIIGQLLHLHLTGFSAELLAALDGVVVGKDPLEGKSSSCEGGQLLSLATEG